VKSFRLSLIALFFAPGYLRAAPVQLVDEAPVEISKLPDGHHLIDFGKVSFGNFRLSPPTGTDCEINIHLGEAMDNKRVNRKPPGSVRYSNFKMSLSGGKPTIAAPPADPRNTKPPAAILTPEDWGTVSPFRWVEIEGWNGELRPEHITRRSAFLTAWDDQAASFACSDPLLNQIWDLCKYSIKATTFAGVYVDGDRERIPYEADAFINQISHYTTDSDIQIARDTYDHLMKNPTWPTEWASHLIFMAYADFMHTGDRVWLGARYESLKSKLFLKRTRPDGLVSSNDKQVKRDDIVDWPGAERDGYVFTPVNTVVNAFHLRTLHLMAEMAKAIGKDTDTANYRALQEKTLKSFQEILFNPATKTYRDGEGTDHTSQHANLFPLAFQLVPEEHRPTVTAFVLSRKMACSVYAAQYLFDGLFQNDASTEALALITAPNDRSWKHMVESGTTITWEAWDQKYKTNQDWNHAWGAAPANLLARYLLGAEPLSPGWSRALIRPHLGNLKSAEGKIPTPKGPLQILWKNGSTFKMSVKLPPGISAKLELPAPAKSKGVTLNNQSVPATRQGNRWLLNEDISGSATLEVN
jgi:alpha-L-rhamnosidase